MRISDWSSDVCSSDLIHIAILPETLRNIAGVFSGWLSNTLDVPKATSLISRPSLIVRVGERRADLQDLTWRTHRVLLSSNLCRSEEHTSELQSLMRISYAVFCLKKKKMIHDIRHIGVTDHDRTTCENDSIDITSI